MTASEPPGIVTAETALSELRRSCTNELCDYVLVGCAAYCCDGCARADEHGYEVHQSGILGHSPACARRQP